MSELTDKIMDFPVGRMDAYYYDFETTGVGMIDAILSEVATAGKSYHHTEYWSEELPFDWKWYYEDRPRASHIDRIQTIADLAASSVLNLVERQNRLELEMHFLQTGECPTCNGTGVIDAAEHKCGWCYGRGYLLSLDAKNLSRISRLHRKVDGLCAECDQSYPCITMQAMKG